jgi:hypothetical protein
VFTLEADMKIPESLVAFVSLLTRSQEDWKKLKSTGKMPKPKSDATTVGIIQDILKKRLGLYPTTIQVSALRHDFSPSVQFGIRQTKICSKKLIHYRSTSDMQSLCGSERREY